MKSKTTLVLGASVKTSRYSNKAIEMLVNRGHPVYGVGHDAGEAYGIEISPTAVPLTGIDTVTLYLNPNNQKEYYDYIVQTGAKRVIFNPGTENPELYELLKKNNIEIEVACTLVMLSTHQY